MECTDLVYFNLNISKSIIYRIIISISFIGHACIQIVCLFSTHRFTNKREQHLSAIIKMYIRDSNQIFLSDWQVTENNMPKQTSDLETGKPLPIFFGDPSHDLLNTPLEELDPFYESQKVFLSLIEFSTKDQKVIETSPELVLFRQA